MIVTLSKGGGPRTFLRGRAESSMDPLFIYSSDGALPWATEIDSLMDIGCPLSIERYCLKDLNRSKALPVMHLEV